MDKRIDIIYPLASGKRISLSVTSEVKATLEEYERHIQNQQRQDRRHIILTDLIDDLLFESWALQEEDVCSILIRKERVEQLYVGINTLTSIQQRRISMYYYYQLPYRIIAKIDGVEISSVVQSIELALNKLKKYCCN